jgi:hypothetical protein
MKAVTRTPKWIALVTSVALATLALQPIAMAAPPKQAETTTAVDEVRLSNGGFVRGEIIELMPGEYVVIKTLSGETRRFEWSKVSSVERGGATITAEPVEGPVEPVEPIPGGVPGGVPGDVPLVEPAPEPEAEPEPEEGGPTPEEPYVHMDVLGKRPMTLHRVTGRVVAIGSGGSASGVSFSRICKSPCDLLVPNPHDEFFVTGEKYAGSKAFTLDQNASVYELKVKPRHQGMLIGGWVMLALGPATTALLATLPFLVNMKRSDARATWALAGVVGAGMIGGGITLMAFGRTKVEVLPRDRSWLESH